MYTHIVINPFIVYSIVWCFVLGVYNLGWSYLFPPLTLELKVFLWSSIILSFITGLAFHTQKVFSYKPIKNIPLYKIKLFLYAIWGLLIIEFIAARGVPLLGYLMGDKSLSYTEFGLPFIHVIVINSFELLFIFLIYCYKSTNDICIKKRLKLYMVFSILPYILVFNRMGLMVCFIGGLIVYIISKQNIVRIFFKILFFSLLAIYLFGYAGDMRQDTSTAKNIILEIGEATPEFKESSIPAEFFWGYLYIASPLSNIQYTINQKKNIQVTEDSFIKFGLFELTPEIISKRVSEQMNIHSHDLTLITSSLNASSVYDGPYNYLGWWGMIFMFFFMYIFIFLSMLFIPKNSPFYVCGIVIIDIIIILNVFNNMFIFMGIVTQVLFVIIMSLKYTRKNFNYHLFYKSSAKKHLHTKSFSC